MKAHQLTRHLLSRSTELNEIYISMSLRTFAISLTAIFIPIYLYNLGYSFQQILIYLILLQIFEGCQEYFSGKVVSWIGAKHTIIVSLPLSALSFFFFYSLTSISWPLWVLALSVSVPASFFYLGYHSDFSKAKHDKSAGKEISRLSIALGLAGALGPFFGGIIAQFYGIKITLVITAALLLLAIIPLRRTKEIVEKRPLNLRKNFSLKRNYKDMIAYSGFGLEASAAFIIWPFFIYILLEDYVRVGVVASIALIIMVLATYTMGSITDRYERKKIIKISGIVNFFGSSLRILTNTINFAYLASILSSVTHIFMYIPFVSEYYLHADEEPRTEYIVGMEMAIDFARALGYIVLYLLSFYFSLKGILVIGILMGSVGSLILIAITSKKNKKEIASNRIPGLVSND